MSLYVCASELNAVGRVVVVLSEEDRRREKVEPDLNLSWPGSTREIVATSILRSSLIPTQLRWRILKLFGYKIHKSSIFQRVTIVGGGMLAIGAEAFINRDCMLDTAGGITIGPRTSIGMGVAIVTSSHVIGDTMRRASVVTAQEVKIGAGAWIGAYARILPGVTIGDGAIIAAGSVVTGDCPQNTMYAGVPAKFKRTIPNKEGE